MIAGKIIKGMLPGILLACSLLTAQEGPFDKITPLKERYDVMPLGEVKPEGWLKDQIQHNLDGFTGHLDSLVPQLILHDDIYGKNRLSKSVKSKNVGALGEEGDWQVQFLWWNSETQSNWWDGYIRSAILTGDKEHLARVGDYVNKILATQDEDGYLGIYDKELRYRFDNENGELWAKATLLRGLLAWYDYTGDIKILEAVRSAVDNVIVNWPAGASQPFYSVNPNVGGLSHGLMFTDVLEQVYYKTGERKYLDYALFLYTDFSSHNLNEDAQYDKLLTTVPLSGHGVHTYEHLRALAAAWYASGNPALGQALSNFESKIFVETTASGGPVGDEWILGKPADATGRGYEYCSLHELLHSYANLFTKTGKPVYADKIEYLFLNAAQGARHPEKSCIAYLKSDNSYEMTGGLNGDDSVATQTRYSYSPVHQEAAVCCVPNAGRIAPYFVQHMWLRQQDTLVAALPGPCTVSTKVKGKNVTIEEKTAYPDEYHITYIVTADNADFTIKIRKPDWADKMIVNGKLTLANDYEITKSWTGQEAFTVRFMPKIEVRADIKGENYFTYGPLLLAHPVEAKEAQTKFFALPGYANLEYTPVSRTVYQYAGKKIKQKGNNLIFETKLYNPDTGKNETLTLVPIGETILRQATFKTK